MTPIPTVTPTPTVSETGFSITTDQLRYSCHVGDLLTVKATLKVDGDIIRGEKKYILYSAYLQKGWQETGGYNIDGESYFENRWECEAKIKEYTINGSEAEFTIEIPTANVSTGTRIFVLSIFPYNKYSVGNSIIDYNFFVDIQ